MAKYPQLDDCQGVWKIKDVGDAVKLGRWRRAGSRAVLASGTTIDYITMSSQGDASDFGDTSSDIVARVGLGSHTRGFFAGGNGQIDVIEFITFVTTGDVTDFGNLTDGVNLTAGL